MSPLRKQGATPKKNGMVQLFLSVKFTVNIEVEDPYSYDDQTTKVKLTSNISGKASQNMLAGAAPTGSRWSIPAIAKFKAKKIKHIGSLRINWVGPQGAGARCARTGRQGGPDKRA